MKKIYTKPLIVVEEMSLNQGIATAVNCTADRDDMEELLAMHFFSDSSCWFKLFVGENEYEGGGMDTDMDGVPDRNHATVCYHTNMTTAFLS